VLVARDEARLAGTAADLHERYLVEVETIAADLSTGAGCELVAARLRRAGPMVSTLVNNAGMGLYGSLTESSSQLQQEVLDLNVRAVLLLTQAALAVMLPAGRGEIINVSSVAGFVPSARSPAYAASKAWVTSFTESVALSVADQGVTVAAICPGLTHTEFHQRAAADLTGVPSWMWMSADQVVAIGLADVRRGVLLSIPGRRYRALLLASRFAPRRLVRGSVFRSR
jgi:short-subunit dehydrogenase